MKTGKKILVALLITIVFSTGLEACVCAGMASCLLIVASMSATVAKTIPDFYRTDNNHFYPELAKVYHLVYTAKKKNEYIANSYKKRKLLVENLILLNNEEEKIKSLENQIPISELQTLEAKINLMLLDVKNINFSFSAKSDLSKKILNNSNNYQKR